MNYSSVVYQDRLPFLIRLLGGRWRESHGRPEFRMKWGELSLKRGLACELCLFEEGFTFHWHAFWINVYLKLRFLRRFAWEPRDIMESWGASLVDGSWHFHWAQHTKIWTLPWRDWMQTSHDVRRADGSWTAYVPDYGTFKNGKLVKEEPDGRHVEVHPYRYVRRSGEVQERAATIYVERRVRKLRFLRWLPWGITRYAIDVQFSDEVGEETGSWKGGTIGCGYSLRPNETAHECLRRMERERRFGRGQ